MGAGRGKVNEKRGRGSEEVNGNLEGGGRKGMQRETVNGRVQSDAKECI